MANSLKWDQIGERLFETGTDHGVLFPIDDTGQYEEGVVWNGLTAVSVAPTGGEANAQYADNMKYLNLMSAEEFAATIEAFTYPDEFAPADGQVVVGGVVVGQQRRRPFGFSWRTRIGNDVMGDEFGYKIHLVYGAQATPSDKSYATVNDTPEAATMSWEVTTTAVAVEGFPQLRATSYLVISSLDHSEEEMKALEDLIYGDGESTSTLPAPHEVLALMAAEPAEPPA